MTMLKEILDYRYSRNGITGEGFHLVIFSTNNGDVLLATLFKTKGHCAIIDPWDKESFMQNLWKCDGIEDELRAAIKAGHESGKLYTGRQ